MELTYHMIVYTPAEDSACRDGFVDHDEIEEARRELVLVCLTQKQQLTGHKVIFSDNLYRDKAAHLLYKIIASRHQIRSTILVTNVDFDAWAEYLGDAPLAMAMLDRLVDGSIIIKLKGPSYRASRSANMNQWYCQVFHGLTATPNE